MNSKPSSELEWLLYHLWLKSSGPAPPQFLFTLADTIFFRNTHNSILNPTIKSKSNVINQDILISENHDTSNSEINYNHDGNNSIPECWYFTSKDGYILKKNRFNVSTKEIYKVFTRKLQEHDQVAAIAYHNIQTYG